MPVRFRPATRHPRARTSTPALRFTLAVALAAIAALHCSSEQVVNVRAELCDCAADEICVNETCVVPSTPVLTEPTPSPTTCSSSATLINELRFAGSAFADFVELRGSPGASLDGYRLIAFDPSGARSLDVQLRGVVPPSGLWLGALGPELENVPDATLSPVGLPAPSGNLVLYDCTFAVLDAVAYGAFEDGDRYAGEGDPAPGTAADQAIARCPAQALSEADSDENAADFALDAASPGEANERLAGSPACTPCSAADWEGKLSFSEVLYDPSGADEQATAFVELAGEAELPLAGVQIESWDEPSGRWVAIGELAGALDASGLALVVEDDGIAGATQVLATIDGPNDGGGFRLRVCDSTLDLVLWGAIADPEAAGGSAAALGPDAADGNSLSHCEGSWVETSPSALASNTCP